MNSQALVWRRVSHGSSEGTQSVWRAGNVSSGGVTVVYLPPYSPEFNPIEHFGWDLKAFVCRFKPKDSDSLHQLVELSVLLNPSHHCKNYFTDCCYCAS
ncbi:transposase [Parathermosynechococcus lividus]